MADYLRAEVELLANDESGSDVDMDEGSAQRLITLWVEIHDLAEQAGEPRMNGTDWIQESVVASSTWRLVELWQNLKTALWAHRERVSVQRQVLAWIKCEQGQGRLPPGPPHQVDVKAAGMPTSIGRELFLRNVRSRKWNAHPDGGHCLPDDFWEPLLRVLAAQDAQKRSTILLEMAREEAEFMRARRLLKEEFSGE